MLAEIMYWPKMMGLQGSLSLEHQKSAMESEVSNRNSNAQAERKILLRWPEGMFLQSCLQNMKEYWGGGICCPGQYEKQLLILG